MYIIHKTSNTNIDNDLIIGRIQCMNNIKYLLIKLTITTTVLFLILGFLQWVDIPNILLISLLITGISYIIGDLFILPRFGKIIASIVNFELIFLTIWFLSSFFIQTAYSVFITSFIIAFLIVCSESFHHILMLDRVLNPVERNPSERSLPKLINSFQTEFSEEIDELNLKKKSSEKQNDEGT